MYAKVQTRRPVELCPCPLQISLLKQSLEMQLSQSQSSLQQLQHQFSQEREHLRMQLDELQTEHQRRQQRLQEVHCCSMQDMEHARQRDLKVGTHTHRVCGGFLKRKTATVTVYSPKHAVCILTDVFLRHETSANIWFNILKPAASTLFLVVLSPTVSFLQ